MKNAAPSSQLTSSSHMSATRLLRDPPSGDLSITLLGPEVKICSRHRHHPKGLSSRFLPLKSVIFPMWGLRGEANCGGSRGREQREAADHKWEADGSSTAHFVENGKLRNTQLSICLHRGANRSKKGVRIERKIFDFSSLCISQFKNNYQFFLLTNPSLNPLLLWICSSSS